jgi:hypothetical protein
VDRKKLIGALGVIILGALGSGLWELIKPLLGWGWSAVLTVATLGIDSLRDGIYADTAAAKPIGTMWAVQSIGALICLTGAIVVSSVRLSFRPTSHLLPLTASTMLLLMTVSLSVTSARTGYVTKLAAYTVQLEIIAAPYLSDVQLKQFRARAVQVKNRTDYLANVEMLRKVIEEAGQKVPSRDFF